MNGQVKPLKWKGAINMVESVLFAIWLLTIGIILKAFMHFDSKPLEDLSFQPEFDRIDL